ncbi:MAG: flagellar protein FlgN [Spirochaetales bacterium]|nr:flagellar protein FlgN [Spirochaetales bacterium]
MEDLLRLLAQEHQLHAALLDNERQKRQAILRARGQDLEVLSRKTEELLREAQKLEQKRLRKSDLSFEDIMRESPESDLRRQLSQEFKLRVEKLRDELLANEELLKHTHRTIHNLLGTLATPESGTYSHGKSKTAERGGLLLNATG